MAFANARSALFVPGSRPERFSRALSSGADVVIVDFEDAVEEQLKQHARDMLDQFLAEAVEVRLLVRVNSADHAEHAADLSFCRRHDGVAGIVLPKAENADQVARAAATGKPVWPIIESAKGLLALGEIASCPGVERLTFGALDLGLDLGLNPGSAAAENVLDQVRLSVLLHSRANGLVEPLDSVFPAFDDLDGLRLASGRARDMGFGGALCIHPKQIPAIHAAFAPTEVELQWARKVLAAAHCAQAAFQLDGQMIDAPVLSRAQRLLAIQEQQLER
ncbi:CoA ester lyase [Pseudomonas sp. H9]|uniref:HpcH/HpaI aldolase/citrate lyase family protein n=1 Tax=Pseudomonas sp. H9 TaxID=483968 RepID=UPI001058050C|nr:CoA ester lyase [Pseudomonas sp. H9]TDF83886.1 CoA ester lyase [Pseudomonas sp. H9]